MLRAKYKNKLIYGAALIGAFSLTIGSAWAVELSSVQTYIQQHKTAASAVKCVQTKFPPTYSTDPEFNKCQSSCSAQLPKITQALEQNIQAALGKDQAATAKGVSQTQAQAAAAAATTAQQSHMNNSSGTQAAGSTAQAERMAAANAASQAFSNCASDIGSACQGIGVPQSQADQAKQACENGAKQAKAVAEAQKATGSTMGDMSQLASALGQALGPLAQMMQGQQDTPMDPGITESPSTIDSPAGTSLADNNTVAGTSIGNGNTPNGAEFKSPKNNITGFGPAGSGAFAPATGYDSLASAGYGDDSSGGTSVGNGYSSGAGSNGLNSSGSSMAPGSSDEEKAAAAAAAEAAGENYEISNMGGGGGKPSFLGLKSRTEEDLGAGESVLGDLGLGEDGNRELASNDEPMGGIGGADGNTLFHVIHNKISEIKKRGSI